MQCDSSWLQIEESNIGATRRPPLILLSQLPLGTLAGWLIRSQLPEKCRTHFGRPRLILRTWQYFNDPLIRENGSALYRQHDGADIPSGSN